MSHSQDFIDRIAEYSTDLRTNVILGCVENIDASDSDGPPNPETFGVPDGDANVWTSRLDGSDYHTPMLDIDTVMVALPSSTAGHHHLFFPNLVCDHEDYMNLLDALARCGIIQPGYAEVSRNRGFTALRLPWVKKQP